MTPKGGMSWIFSPVGTSKLDMPPSERGYVRSKLWRAVETGVFLGSNGLPEVLDDTVDDHRGQQVQPGHSRVLDFGCTVSDFTLMSDP